MHACAHTLRQFAVELLFYDYFVNIICVVFLLKVNEHRIIHSVVLEKRAISYLWIFSLLRHLLWNAWTQDWSHGGLYSGKNGNARRECTQGWRWNYLWRGTTFGMYIFDPLFIRQMLITHTHTFNGPLSGTTRVSRYQEGKTSLDFTEARDSEWQWHQLGICKSAPRSR